MRMKRSSNNIKEPVLTLVAKLKRNKIVFMFIVYHSRVREVFRAGSLMVHNSSSKILLKKLHLLQEIKYQGLHLRDEFD